MKLDLRRFLDLEKTGESEKVKHANAKSRSDSLLKVVQKDISKIQKPLQSNLITLKDIVLKTKVDSSHKNDHVETYKML